MKKFTIIISFCFIFTLRAMEEQSNEISIEFAQRNHIPALIALSREASDEFFKPAMVAGYPDNPSIQNPEVLNEFFNEIDVLWGELLEKATSNVDDTGNCVLLASHNADPDKILGFCAFSKENASLFIQYLVVSQQLRGKGIGKALLNKALSTHEDITVCRLVTLAYGNAATHAFYEHLGFTSTKELCTAVERIPNTHFMYQLDINK